MDNAKLDDDLPLRWVVTRGPGAGGARGHVRIGAKTVSIDDIEGVYGDETRDRPIAGLLLGAIGFLCFATFLTHLVLDGGWRPRFLIGAAFFGGLALAGLSEIFYLRPESFFVFKIRTRTQGVVTFATTDAKEATAFRIALTRAGVPA